MATALRHWLGTKKYQVGQNIRAFAYRTGTPFGQRVVNDFWEEQAPLIHDQWGDDNHDFAILQEIFVRHAPTSILDVGCGSGRLFELYSQQGITDVVGLDISAQALAIAQERYPAVPTIQGKVEDLDFPDKRFSVAICNRVLQHIPPNAIEGAMKRLCQISTMIYVNELTDSDQISEEFFMFRHAYPTLFAQQGFSLTTTGTIGKQTYFLFSS